MMREPPFGLITADGRPPRVAVVDGNALTAMLTGMLIEQFGCRIVRAATGEALLALVDREGFIDLVVMELAIPDMDGMVAAQLIRALGPRGAMPIIALVSTRSDGADRRARAAGFTATVIKPYSPRELYGAIHAALARAQVPA